MRRLLWTLAIVAAVLFAARLALNPFVSHRTQKVLDSLHGYRGSFHAGCVGLRSVGAQGEI